MILPKVSQNILGHDTFPEEVEDRELPNSHAVDEIPSTSGFDSQMPHAEDVELLNACLVVEVDLNEIPSTLGFDSTVLRSLAMEVSPFHVIFDLNKVLIATHSNISSHTIIFHPRLKEFFEKCLAQFQSILSQYL